MKRNSKKAQDMLTIHAYARLAFFIFGLTLCLLLSAFSIDSFFVKVRFQTLKMYRSLVKPNKHRSQMENNDVSNCSLVARFLRFENSVVGGFINIAEIEAFDLEGKVLTLNKKCIASSTYNNDPKMSCSIVNDGRKRGMLFFHSNSTEKTEFIEIDLGKEEHIASVAIHNRRDCCWDRMAGQTINYSWIEGVELFLLFLSLGFLTCKRNL